MDVSQVIRHHREARGLTQAELAEFAGVDKRQIRRYEADEAHPPLSVAANIARALGVSLDELAGTDTTRPDLTGTWHATPLATDSEEEAQRVEIVHHGDTLTLVATTGDETEPGALVWRGEARLWDGDTVMGWYTATNPTHHAKGVLYLVLDGARHQLAGHWTGTTAADGPITTGPATLTRDPDPTPLADEAHPGSP